MKHRNKNDHKAGWRAWVSVGGLGAWLLVPLAVASAQTLQDVVVSVSRAEQRSFDAPAAIDSVDRATIEAAGPQVNLSESLNRVPGLTILNRQNYAQDLQLSIRGFGARSAFGIRGIRLLVDGIPATTPDGQAQGSTVSLTSAERIEVLRGPLALLYGNSAGGVIQAFTREAPAQPEFSVQYHAGSWDMRRSDWQYAGRIGGVDGVGLVADYSTFSTDGFRSNSRTERNQFNGKLSWSAGADTQLGLVFNAFDMPLAQDPLGLTATQLAQDPTQAGTNAEARRTRKIVSQNQLGGTVTHALDAQRSLSARLYLGTRDNLQYQTGAPSSTGAWVALKRFYDGLGLQYNAQSRWGSAPVRWVLGYDFDRSREYREGGAAALGEKTTTTRSEDNQAENSDVYAQATALVAAQWSLTAGLRHSTVRMRSEDYYLSDGNGSGSVSYSAASPVLGLTWHASDTLNVYANYGRGFETPTLAEMAYALSGATVVNTFNTTLNAASSQHQELGLKWAGARWRLDATLFAVRTSDEIVVAASTGGNTTFKNAPGTSRQGLELAARGQLAAHWRGTLAATAIDATYTERFCTSTTCTAANTVQAGNKMPGIPQHYVFAELLWAQRPLQDGLRLLPWGWQAGAELVNAGRLYANDLNTASADGYTVLNLKASHGWALSGKGLLVVYARLDNVSDQRYVGSVIVNQTSGQFYEPAPGYNWTLGARLTLPL
jgi:iron complex outermembrane receptor protein